MPTTNVKINADDWTNLTNNSANGTLRVVAGSRVHVVQATTAVAAADLTPMQVLEPQQEPWVYSGVPSGENLWGYVVAKPLADDRPFDDTPRRVGGTSVVAVTPAEV